MNRREFLGTAAALGAAATFPRTTAADQKRKIKTGFLGVGHSHASEKIRIVRESESFELTGLWAENDELKARLERQNLPILEQDQIVSECDLVVVESAVRTLAPLAKRALLAGCHVHVEKPPAPTADAFQELQTLAREKRCLLQVGYMWRFNPALVRALEAARNGWLGEVFLVRGTMNTLLAPSRRPEWAEFPGGATFEQGCHLIDPLVRLLGRPETVTPFLKTHGGLPDGLADNCVVVFEFAQATGIITNSTLQPNAGPQRFFEILGTNGSATIKPIEPPSLELELAEEAGPYKAGRQSVPLAPFRRYVDEFAELARCIQEGTELGVAPEDEWLVHETVLRASRMI
jgi:predicted dehydrogenase